MRRFAPGLLALAGAVALTAGPLLADGDNVSAALDAARAALQKGDGIAAEAELKKALDAGAPRDVVAPAMGEALIDQGELPRAREWLGSGQFAKGQEAYGLRMLGMLERNSGNLPAAGAAYDRALLFAPKDPLLWVDIGRLRYMGGEQLQALDASERALAAGPENVRALEFRAQLLRDSIGHAAALPLYEKALDQAPDDLSLLGGYASSLGEMGRTSEMLAVTRHMIEVAPKHPYAWYLQAVLAARAGKMELARGLLAKAGDRLRDMPAAMLLSGIVELEAGNAHVAVGSLERLGERQPANLRLQMLLARAYYESNDYNALIQRFDAEAQRPDAPAYLLTLLGRAYEELGDREKAAPLLDRAAAASVPTVMPIIEGHPPAILAPRWADAQGAPGEAVPYVRALLGAGDLAGASRVAGRFLQLHPGSAEALWLMGDVDLAQGQAAAAFQHYQLSARVRFPDQLMLRATEALDKAGRGRDALPLVGRYLGAYPSSRLAARIAASHAAFGGNWEEAKRLLDSLRQRGGNRDVRLLADLSLAQLRLGDNEAALESAERASLLQPSSGVAAQARAMALVGLGRDLPLARQLLDKARRLGGDNPLLAETRAKLSGKDS